MKKFLLGAIALIGFGMVAGAAMADNNSNAMPGNGPIVSIGGFADFEAGWASQKSQFETPPFNRKFKLRDYDEIHVNVNGQTDNGIGYGAVIQLEADVTPDDTNFGANADKTYIFLESRLGRLEFGSNTDAARTLKVDAATFARASGGIDGDWYHWVNLTGTNQQQMFIIRPDLPTAHALGTRAPNANKITYYSPRIGGVQFGLSFTPDQGDIGTATGWTGNTNGDYQNVVNTGLNYTTQFGQVSLAAAVTGEFARNELAIKEDLRAYNGGLNLGYAGFTLGGSYGGWDRSTQLKALPGVVLINANGSGQSKYWDLGAAYETGPYALSLTYLGSTYAGVNKFSNISAGTDYKLAPGLTPFLEANFFKLDQGGATESNSGTVALVGTQLNF